LYDNTTRTLREFCRTQIKNQQLKEFKTISFSHQTIGVDKIGVFYIAPEQWEERLSIAKQKAQFDELMFVSTCNRSEFWLVQNGNLTEKNLCEFFSALYPNWETSQVQWAVDHAQQFEGVAAVDHVFRVSSSLKSLVIGEREIITQVREAFDVCHKYNLTGDLLRIVMRKTIEAAKQVFTETEIANKPVSVVNLAFRLFKNYELQHDAKIVMVGAGVTNAAMFRNLRKAGYKNITVYNRTLSKAQELAEGTNCKALPLSELPAHTDGFNALISCTSSSEAVITPELYTKLNDNDNFTKILIDLAVPNDFDPKVIQNNKVEYIEVDSLKEIAQKNLEARKNEIDRCNTIIENSLGEFTAIYKERKVELAMRDVPVKIKAIKSFATEKVFAKELEQLDTNSKEVLEKVLAYMEKKYISMPMKMAKQILLSDQ
jgi:glutamyl-tRNA reductase